MGEEDTQIICYVDDVIIMKKNDDDQQRLITHFEDRTKKYFN